MQSGRWFQFLVETQSSALLITMPTFGTNHGMPVMSFFALMASMDHRTPIAGCLVGSAMDVLVHAVAKMTLGQYVDSPEGSPDPTLDHLRALPSVKTKSRQRVGFLAGDCGGYQSRKLVG